MKIPESKKYASHTKSFKDKNRRASVSPKNKSKKKKSVAPYLVSVVVLIALSLSLIPSLLKSKSKESQAVIQNSNTVEDPNSLEVEESGNNSVIQKEETTVLVEGSKVLNLFEDNGAKYFDTPSKFFSFKNNHLFIDDLGKGTPDELITKDSYENFKLTSEYRFLKDNSDSGIHFHIKGKGFYEVQLSLTKSPKSGTLMSRGGFHFTNNGHKQFQKTFTLENAEAPMGEWSKVIIEYNEGILKVTLNDILLHEVSGLSNTKGFISITRWKLCEMEYRKLELEILD